MCDRMTLVLIASSLKTKYLFDKAEGSRLGSNFLRIDPLDEAGMKSILDHRIGDDRGFMHQQFASLLAHRCINKTGDIRAMLHLAQRSVNHCMLTNTWRPSYEQVAAVDPSRHERHTIIIKSLPLLDRMLLAVFVRHLSLFDREWMEFDDVLGPTRTFWPRIRPDGHRLLESHILNRLSRLRMDGLLRKKADPRKKGDLYKMEAQKETVVEALLPDDKLKLIIHD